MSWPNWLPIVALYAIHASFFITAPDLLGQVVLIINLKMAEP
jgi:hypothetical protein